MLEWVTIAIVCVVAWALASQFIAHLIVYWSGQTQDYNDAVHEMWACVFMAPAVVPLVWLIIKNNSKGEK
jgi:hypothetical protein